MKHLPRQVFKRFRTSSKDFILRSALRGTRELLGRDFDDMFFSLVPALFDVFYSFFLSELMEFTQEI